MIWAKTDAGRAEVQAKALVRERAQRNLLLLIDGRKSEQMLLDHVAGITVDDFTLLESMGLIEPLPSPVGVGPIGATALANPVSPIGAVPTKVSETADAAANLAPADFGPFMHSLTQVISTELGLRGIPLSMAVERAGTLEQLMQLANRAIEQIRDRKGAPAAEAARRALYGG